MRTQLRVTHLRRTCALGALNLPRILTAQRSYESREKAPTFLVVFFFRLLTLTMFCLRALEVARSIKPRSQPYRRLFRGGDPLPLVGPPVPFTVPVAAASRVCRPREEGVLPSLALPRQPLLPPPVAPEIDVYLRDTAFLCPAPVGGRISRSSVCGKTSLRTFCFYLLFPTGFASLYVEIS